MAVLYKPLYLRTVVVNWKTYIYIYIYIHTHTHTRTHIYMYMYIYVSKWLLHLWHSSNQLWIPVAPMWVSTTWVPTDISPFGVSVVAGPALVALRMVARCTSAAAFRELWENICCFPVSEGIPSTWRATQLGFKQIRQETWDPGFCLDWGQRWST